MNCPTAATAEWVREDGYPRHWFRLTGLPAGVRVYVCKTSYGSWEGIVEVAAHNWRSESAPCETRAEAQAAALAALAFVWTAIEAEEAWRRLEAIPVGHRCVACQGRGEIKTACPYCKGTGDARAAGGSWLRSLTNPLNEGA
jgi:hypothetical protein